ncbi:MAG: hypothetical protein HC899_20005 [Leptolyngbyaceae cyanobacterium SM1_4_3]|nr:hypothetical protein [Leptolyngbyaceae cyanobacterium SM1_4_3]NJN91699.1 hypothetical protein [Leptolyngbyaceae cyanobacterium SL_5_14]
MNPKSVLLLSGASVVLLAPSAIANPAEAIPDPAVAVEADLQTPEPVVVEVQVSPPEQMVEAIAPIPTPISPPEPFAPDFSAPLPPTVEAIAPLSEYSEAARAIAPTPPKYVEEPEPIPAAAEGISPLPAQVEEFDKPPQAAVPEATSTDSPENLPEAIEEIEGIDPTEPIDPIEPIELIDPIESVESAEMGAIAPVAKFPKPSNTPADALPDDLLNEWSEESDNSLSEELPAERSDESSAELSGESGELGHELPNESLNQFENGFSEDSPRLYGEPEADTDLIERLAQDDLDSLSPDEWIDLLITEEADRSEENALENWNSSADLAGPESVQRAEFSQANGRSDTSFDRETETAPRYRVVVGDRSSSTFSPTASIGFHLTILTLSASKS